MAMKLSVATLVWLALVPARVSGQGGEKGILVDGWMGRLEPQAEKRGGTLKDVRLATMGSGVQATTGPAVAFWQPTAVGKGVYTVRATFAQTAAQRGPDHYGLFVGGSNLGNNRQNYLYCAIAGSGTFVVRHRLGDELHELAGRTVHAAIRRTDASGRASNDLQWRVTPDRTSCVVNGTEVWSFSSRALVGPGKLESTDGIAGLRIDGNLDVLVSGFSVGK
jgi:hypothetical protein